jgi:UDP-glucose 4-epimerase
MANVFVTGGAGYIGSHMVAALGEAGHAVVVYDNLSTGAAANVLFGDLVVGDLADTDRLDKAVADAAPDVAIHFAGSVKVDESVAKPYHYYRNNTVNTINLADALERAGCRRIIFSSTAAVYGEPDTRTPLSESLPLAPINPYGTSKMMAENILRELGRLGRLSPVTLRYFNVAGADPAARIGFDVERSPHLIPRAVRAALGGPVALKIFGTDLPTDDGTCIRDYIHVVDLVDAHMKAMDWLLGGGGGATFNVGYGTGFSVRQVVEAVKTTLDRPAFAPEEAPYREGDPYFLVADSSRLAAELGWRPTRNALSTIIEDTAGWIAKRGV